jgi:hypothetical protein
MTVYGGQFSWPGVGHVAEEKDEFRYFPEATKWVSKLPRVRAALLPTQGVFQSSLPDV